MSCQKRTGYKFFSAVKRFDLSDVFEIKEFSGKILLVSPENSFILCR